MLLLKSERQTLRAVNLCSIEHGMTNNAVQALAWAALFWIVLSETQTHDGKMKRLK